MGLLQKAVETYEAHTDFIGVARDGHQPIAPVSHIITNASFEIALDMQGELKGIEEVAKEEAKTVIPATEESAGRTSAPCPHPLCEQVGYLSGENPKKFTMYVEQLQAWADSQFSHPMLCPILTYVKKKTLLQDLAAYHIEKPGEKQLIRWKVLGDNVAILSSWKERSLFQSFIQWYNSVRVRPNDEKTLCMISGETIVPARQHPKGIIPMNGNAKLISANDTSNFTYRGRFTDDQQAVTISYEASQKAHNALRWLAVEQGARIVFGGRTFLCWNPQGKQTCSVILPDFQKFWKKPATEPTQYKAELQKTLEGWRDRLPDNSGGVIIAAFDAATTGRLALTYYRELRESDFLQRLHDWDETCCWWAWNPEDRRDNAIQSPPLWHIVNCAFGTQREEKGKVRLVTDDRLMKQQLQRLLSCRVDRAKFPLDLKKAIVDRASMPLGYDPMIRKGMLMVACAVVRKYHYDRNKEELSMTLEEKRADRSYQFGRLLAVLEKVERDTYREDETREPNAIRLQSRYFRRPLHTANLIERQLESAYFPRMKNPSARIWYRNLIGEIMGNLDGFSRAELEKPLEDTYLLGYYLQRSELYRSKKQMDQQEENRS